MHILAAWVLRAAAMAAGVRVGRAASIRVAQEVVPVWAALQDAADEYDGGPDGRPWWAGSEVQA